MQPDVISGRYRVVRAIGRGGMGTVWLCRDEVLRRDVAVKQMGSFPGEDTESTTRAMREARVSAAMNHENAVAVFDVVDHDGGTWLVMEYFPSQTLAELVAADGPLAPERAAGVGAQVASALASAHGLGIVHRDIKPGNILVGAGDAAKLSDFGIARGHTDMSLTQTGMMTGTPGYFAPELAHGGDPSFASDAWAFGATLFTAVEGEPPYPTQANPLAVLSMITREQPPTPARAGPVAPVIAALMQRDPGQRLSMERAQRDLAAIADGAGSDRTRTFAVGDGAPGAPAGAAAAGAAGDMAATPPDDGFTSGWQTTQQSVDPEPAYSDDSDDRRRGWLVAAVVLLVVLGIGAAAWAAFAPGDGDNEPTAAAGTTKQQTDPKTTPTKSTESTATTEPTTEPTTPDETTTEETTTSETTESTESTDAPAPSDPADFVSNYYTLVPGDTDAGWAQLSPSFRSTTTRSSYDNFWNSYSSVNVTNVQAVSPTVVNYTISYDGSTPENKQITLVGRGSSYLINSDGEQ